MGLVLDDIARLCGVKARGIPCNWELGKRVPSIEVQMRLADLFGCSLDYLHGREGAERDSPAVARAKRELRRRLLQTEVPPGSAPADLVALVYGLLQEIAPRLYTREWVALHLTVSEQVLAEVLAGGLPVYDELIYRFAALTGLPDQWFYRPEPGLILTWDTLVDELQRHGERNGTTPDQVLRLLRQPGKPT